jgi:hypothetical protein
MSIELATAINILMTTYKTVKSLADKANNLELKGIIVDMGGQILDLEMAAKEYQLKINELEAEIKRITALKERELSIKDGAYYDKNGDGPFCPNCYDNRTELRRLSTGYPLKNLLVCNACKYEIEI